MARKLTFQYNWFGFVPGKTVDIEVDETAVSAVKAQFPQYAEILDNALVQWCENGVPVVRGCIGTTHSENNTVVRSHTAPGCCLIGAFRLGRLGSASGADDGPDRFAAGVEYAWSIKERLGPLTTNTLRDVEVGFDYSRRADANALPSREPAAAFGFAVARALQLPSEES